LAGKSERTIGGQSELFALCLLLFARGVGFAAGMKNVSGGIVELGD
jgi:hypothetical protein